MQNNDDHDENLVFDQKTHQEQQKNQEQQQDNTNDDEMSPGLEEMSLGLEEKSIGAAKIEELINENVSLKDSWLRAEAESQNIRQRSARELADSRSYAISRFAIDILTIADNLQMALTAFDKSAKDTAAKKDASSRAVALHEGLEVTERELKRILQKYGVEQIDTLGARFDPHLHQAIFEVPTNDIAPGHVVQVIQTGYTIAERTLRPAMVGVAKAVVSEDDPEQQPAHEQDEPSSSNANKNNAYDQSEQQPGSKINKSV